METQMKKSQKNIGFFLSFFQKSAISFHTEVPNFQFKNQKVQLQGLQCGKN